ncbi:MAG: site-specific integrase [Alicyclobacillaceae bacterium]|nr:site-specific integrase [Alicyclobacillaceae bacterium]
MLDKSIFKVDRALFEHRVERYLERSHAENSRRAYRSDWQDFVQWCQAHQRQSLPATPETVAAYISALAEAGAKTSTIVRRLSSLSLAHQAKQWETPTRSLLVRTVWRGIRREHGIAAEPKQPILTDELRKMIDAIDTTTLRGLRDQALLLIGFAGAFRRSELVALRWEDVEFREDGVVMTIPQSKTDQEGEGQRIAIVRGQQASTCPVTALQTWLDEAFIVDGPIFRKVNKSDNVEPRALTAQSVALIVKRYAQKVGLDPDQFAGHSLRAGFATQAAVNGVLERDIMRQTRHKSLVTLRRYIREGSLFRDNPSGRVGL